MITAWVLRQQSTGAYWSISNTWHKELRLAKQFTQLGKVSDLVDDFKLEGVTLVKAIFPEPEATREFLHW